MRIIILLLMLSLEASAVLANPFSGGAPQAAVKSEKPSTNYFYTYLTEKQREIRTEITDTFKKIKEKPFSAELFVFAVLSFVYGVFHSMGPGHAKSLVSAYMLSSSSGLIKAAMFGTVVAFGHAFSSFFLVAVLYYVMKTSLTGGFDSASVIFSNVSYGLIFVIGLYLLYRKIRGGEELKKSSAGIVGSAAVISLTPCPGAMVLAVFCFSGGLPLLGAVSVFSMALGMSLTISTVAVLSAYIKLKGASGRYKSVYGLVEYMGISVLLGFSVFMLVG